MASDLSSRFRHSCCPGWSRWNWVPFLTSGLTRASDASWSDSVHQLVSAPSGPPLRAHTHRPCWLPPTQGRPMWARALSSSQAQGLCSCWLVRHLLRDVLGGPVTSAFTAPRRGCASEELDWWWRRRLVERGYGVRKRKKLVLGLTVKHCRRKPPGVLCGLLSTERATGIWGPHSVPTANQGCPERARGQTVAQLLEAGGLCGSRLCSCLFSALWFNIRFTGKTAEPSWSVPQCWRLAWRGLLLLGRLESLSERP